MGDTFVVDDEEEMGLFDDPPPHPATIVEKSAADGDEIYFAEDDVAVPTTNGHEESEDAVLRVRKPARRIVVESDNEENDATTTPPAEQPQKRKKKGRLGRSKFVRTEAYEEDSDGDVVRHHGSDDGSEDTDASLHDPTVFHNDPEEEAQSRREVGRLRRLKSLHDLQADEATPVAVGRTVLSQTELLAEEDRLHLEAQQEVAETSLPQSKDDKARIKELLDYYLSHMRFADRWKDHWEGGKKKPEHFLRLEKARLIAQFVASARVETGLEKMLEHKRALNLPRSKYAHMEKISANCMMVRVLINNIWPSYMGGVGGSGGLTAASSALDFSNVSPVAMPEEDSTRTFSESFQWFYRRMVTRKEEVSWLDPDKCFAINSFVWAIRDSSLDTVYYINTAATKNVMRSLAFVYYFEQWIEMTINNLLFNNGHVDCEEPPTKELKQPKKLLKRLMRNRKLVAILHDLVSENESGPISFMFNCRKILQLNTIRRPGTAADSEQPQ